MPLFGEKFSARLEAARVEYARLTALSSADIAAELMPAFGPDGTKHLFGSTHTPQIGQLLDWLQRNCRAAVPTFKNPLRSRVGEAVGLLEHAGLVYVISINSEGVRRWSATQLGLAALASGDYRPRIEKQTGAAPAAVASAAVTPPRESVAQRLQELETLRATGVISDAEYSAKREQIIAEI